MLYYLSVWLRRWSEGTEWAELAGPLRVFDYVTFRSAGAALTALLLSLVAGPRFFRELVRWKFGQQYQDPGAQLAATKAGRLRIVKDAPAPAGQESVAEERAGPQRQP